MAEILFGLHLKAEGSERWRPAGAPRPDGPPALSGGEAGSARGEEQPVPSEPPSPPARGSLARNPSRGEADEGMGSMTRDPLSPSDPEEHGLGLARQPDRLWVGGIKGGGLGLARHRDRSPLPAGLPVPPRALDGGCSWHEIGRDQGARSHRSGRTTFPQGGRRHPRGGKVLDSGSSSQSEVRGRLRGNPGRWEPWIFDLKTCRSSPAEKEGERHPPDYWVAPVSKGTVFHLLGGVDNRIAHSIPRPPSPA